MRRREFLSSTALAALGITSGLGYSCNEPSPGITKTPGEFNFSEATIDALQLQMKNGQTSSESLTQAYLDRINAIDKKGPAINSVIELNPDAVATAKSMDAERKQGKIRGPLHGIPVLIKDNIDTADAMLTTAGSLALVGNKPAKDAFIVKQLREAGAVILGKTNLSEWANFRSSRSVSGWSSRGGQTKNPYILDRSPCGSSSGSAVAVAANLCVVAVGTETNGSIACPASMNGIVGIKPTVGLLSRSGIIPISVTQDTSGPFGRTVTDAAILLGVLAGYDASDPKSDAVKAKQGSDYRKYLVKNGLQGKRVGIEKTFLKVHEGIDPILRRSLDDMKKAGAEIVEVEFMKKTNDVNNAEFQVLLYEFKDGLNKYLSTSNTKMKTLQDIIAYNKKDSSHVMPYFLQEIMDSAQAKGGLDNKHYLDALHQSLGIRQVIDDLLTTQRLDALCGPATGTAWCVDFINGDFWTGYGAYGPAALAGYPSVTVPMGNFHELPIGISFMGRAFDEGGLISIAYAYEQVSQQRVPPQFKSTLV